MIRVTNDVMTSDAGEFRAFRLDNWLVSWLPRRILDRKEALMAMHLAEIYSGDPARDTSWALVARDYEKALHLPRGFRPGQFRPQVTDLSQEEQ